MRIVRAILLGWLFLSIGAGFAQAAAEEKPVPVAEEKAVPVIEIENPTYEFEEVAQGEVVKHNFRVFNRGNGPLEIRSVKPG